MLSIFSQKMTEEKDEVYEQLAENGGLFWNNVDDSILFSGHPAGVSSRLLIWSIVLTNK